MRDRNNLTIRQGDRLLIQTGGPDSPIYHGTAESTKHGYCKDLGLVLVRFDNRTAQYMDGKGVEGGRPGARSRRGGEPGNYFSPRQPIRCSRRRIGRWWS